MHCNLNLIDMSQRKTKALFTFVDYLESCKRNLSKRQFTLCITFKFISHGKLFSNTVFASSVGDLDYAITLYNLYFKISSVLEIDLDYLSSIRKSYRYV